MQEFPANFFLQGAVWPISAFVVGPDQPDPRHISNPNPEPEDFEGLEVSRGERSHAAPPRFVGGF